MKKLMVVSFVVALVGCFPERKGGQTTWEECVVCECSGLGYEIHAFMYRGHEYLTRSNGGIVHSESCPCKFTGNVK